MSTPNFDGIAGLYRWLEYLSLGRMLERTRLAHLERLPVCPEALVLGDGDGRFTARLMAAQPWLMVDAVDLSGAMLRLLRENVGAHGARLTTHRADARTFQASHPCALVVTHFLLDCLTDAEAAALISRLGAEVCTPRATWLISEFRVPPGFLRWPARLYISALYVAFRVLTGLRVSRLPEYHEPMRTAGFTLVRAEYRLFGLLVSELWQRAAVGGTGNVQTLTSRNIGAAQSGPDVFG